VALWFEGRLQRGHEREEKEDIVEVNLGTAVTMKNVVFWDIKPLFVLHRGHITSPLQSPGG
jgi:hypothetical protein